MMFCLSHLRPVLILALISALALAGACSSDNFGVVGGSMPTDVSQDQDSIEIDLPPIYPVIAEVVTPLDTIPVEERPALYIGHRPGGGWRGTPLVQFDVGDSVVQEKLPLDWAEVNSVELRITGMVQAADAAVVREVRAYELLSPLSSSDALVADVTTLLGAELGTATWNKGVEGVIVVPLAVAEGWFNSGMHNGIALVHVAPDSVPDLYSNFAGYAADEFSSSSRLYGGISSSPPVLQVKNFEEDKSFEVPVMLDLGHLEHPQPGPQDLQIGSYIERRLWINFDLNPDIVAVDATINSGFLVLHQVSDDFTMQVRPFSSFGSSGAIIINQQVRVWEAARSEAGDDPAVEEAHGRGNREVIDASANFNPDPGGGDPDESLADGEFRIDVTEYVQRQVNEIVPDDLPEGAAIADVGLLVGFVNEQLDLDLGVFYGLDASDDLKPRLEITYTPPADSWR
jgi:hypothetical protein